MTRQELLSLEHLAIAEVTKFVHIHAEEGWYITDWDSKDIKQYNGSNCFYMPIRDTYNDYRVITTEEHNKLLEMQETAIKAEINKEDANEQ